MLESTNDPQEGHQESPLPLPSSDLRDNLNSTSIEVAGDKLNGFGNNNKLAPTIMDPETGDEIKKPRKPPFFRSIRYYVMALALVSPFVTTYSRTIINFVITDMIDPEFVEIKAKLSDKDLMVNGTTPYFDLDHSCPVIDDEDRQRLIAEMKSDTERARSGPGDKFKWDTFKQGLLKAAFSIGHTPFQIPGSRLSEMYGSQKVLSICSFLITISCLLAPYLAAVHFYLIFFDLILLGVWGSFMTPALITLFANWLTPSEKSVMISFYLVASRLGYALSSFLCGILIEAQYSWRYVFFSAGWISLAFSAFVFFGARSRPQDHPLISALELDYLASKNTLVKEALARKKMSELSPNVELEEISSSVDKKGTNGVQTQTESSSKKIKTSAPWLAIITNVPVVAFVITKFCVKLSTDTIQIELPSYLKRVMHFSPKNNGLVNAFNYVMFCGGCLGVGALASRANKARPFGLSKTAIRKTFQCISSFGVSLILVGIAYSVCDDTLTQILLILFFSITTFGIGGEAQMPMDLTNRYSGTIHALGSSLAISGVIEPTLVGYLLRGHAADRDSWKSVWLGASAIAFTGGLVFLLFGNAETQPFDNLNQEVIEEDEKPITENNNGKVNRAFENDNDATNVDGQISHRESIQI